MSHVTRQSGSMGTCTPPHIIFASKGGGFTDEMVPSFEALISNTECGIQTRESFLARVKYLCAQMDARGVPNGRVLVTDGHASHFSIPLFEYLESVDMDLYLEPPDSSTNLQMLDQVFRALHAHFDKTMKKMLQKDPNRTIDHKLFLEVITIARQQWILNTDFMKAFAKVTLCLISPLD
jgi:hypothetical protein